MVRLAITRVILLGITILVIPVVPIVIIFAGVSSPDYVIKGTLNLQAPDGAQPSYVLVYWEFLKSIVHCDFGMSTASGRPAMTIVRNGFLESAKIILPAIVIACVAGTLLGVWSHTSRFGERLWRHSRFLFFIPIVIFSYLAVYALSYVGISVLSPIRYLLAAVILAVYPTYVIASALRKTVGEIRKSRFFRLHQATGFSPSDAWRVFCWKFLLIDYLSFALNLLIFMFGFLFFVEAPFGIDGMGQRFILAVHRYDYPVVIGYCLVAILVIGCVGFVIDVAKAGLDPRKSNV